MLTPQEKSFRDVFLHEATTPPFAGPATQALHNIYVEYSDLSYTAWAYEHDVPGTSIELGHSADVALPLPWATQESFLRCDTGLQRLWEKGARTFGQSKFSGLANPQTLTFPAGGSGLKAWHPARIDAYCWNWPS